ncbi:MAG: UPF0182 family protein, partial [Fimbriimonas ginsengisoli]|nr:UPF0182 family protein [Fimbriimonas ginsengisoli]
PTFMTRDIPVRTIPELAIDRPQIYFSDFRGLRGEPEDEYALVDTDVKEFDYPTEEGSNTHRWAGLGGIPVGTPWLRLLYSAALKDGNLLISGNITSRSRLLMHRGVLDRAQLLYPFLKFDPDPYIVILGGKLVWVLDGYTMTDMIPYSHIEEGAERLNYARNPAKVTIDAYTGEPHAYAIQPDEPILAAYRSIYPGLVSDASELPAGLEAHFRYPEQLLMLQARQLTQYHVTDPGAFLANNDAWDLPLNRGMSGNMEPLEAYYVQMRLPDEPREGFMLILPFTPRQRNNMNGWLAAHCDPGDYGKLVLYRFTKGTNVPGPAQMESNFSQNAEIANINRQLTNDQSQIIVGNLLVVPIGQSVMYVEPMFLASRTVGIAPIPQLKKVILALKDKVVVGESYAEALAKLFPAATAPAPQQAPPQPSAGKGFQAGPPKAPAVPSGAAAEALKLF